MPSLIPYNRLSTIRRLANKLADYVIVLHLLLKLNFSHKPRKMLKYQAKSGEMREGSKGKA